jgi:hypothetical protein
MKVENNTITLSDKEMAKILLLSNQTNLEDAMSYILKNFESIKASMNRIEVKKPKYTEAIQASGYSRDGFQKLSKERKDLLLCGIWKQLEMYENGEIKEGDPIYESLKNRDFIK